MIDSPNKSLQDLMENLPIFMGSQLLYAKLLKARYEALVTVGFTKDQAFQIILKHGMGV